MIISLAGGDTIRIDEQFHNLGWDRIETFQFDDQTLTFQQMVERLMDQAGTSGNDTIVGFSGGDTLVGRGGNDVLIGGEGNDLYIYRTGDGDDAIRDGGASATDSLRLDGFAFADAAFTRASDDSDDLIISFSGGGSVRIDEQFHYSAWDRVESFQFDDQSLTYQQLVGHVVDQAGTSGNDTIIGFSGADTLIGRGGNDVLIGGEGNDLYIYRPGDGDDAIRDGGASATDSIRLDGFSFADATFTRASDDSDDLIISFSGGGSVRIDEQFHYSAWDRVETFQFNDLTVSYSDILGFV